MSYKDFKEYWDQLEICNLSPHSLGDDDCASEGRCAWHVKTVEGKILSKLEDLVNLFQKVKECP